MDRFCTATGFRGGIGEGEKCRRHPQKIKGTHSVKVKASVISFSSNAISKLAHNPTMEQSKKKTKAIINKLKTARPMGHRRILLGPRWPRFMVFWRNDHLSSHQNHQGLGAGERLKIGPGKKKNRLTPQISNPQIKATSDWMV